MYARLIVGLAVRLAAKLAAGYIASAAGVTNYTRAFRAVLRLLIV